MTIKYANFALMFVRPVRMIKLANASVVQVPENSSMEFVWKNVLLVTSLIRQFNNAKKILSKRNKR